MATKKAAAPAAKESRLADIKLASTVMPDGKTTRMHPLVWLMKEKLGEDRNKSDLARHLQVAPQSLYKWERLCRGDRNYPLPIPRAMQIAKFFRVKPGLFRPDIFGA